MTRGARALGEKPLFWVGSAKGDLLEFPEDVQDDIGVALSVAQFGGKHPISEAVEGRTSGSS
jgi:phage-related protein